MASSKLSTTAYNSIKRLQRNQDNPLQSGLIDALSHVLSRVPTRLSAVETQVKEFSIKISAQSQYQPDRSSPEEGRYVFAYTITIENQGEEPARLLDRHWIITDADGKAQEVREKGSSANSRICSRANAFSTPAGPFCRPRWAACTAAMG